MAIDKKVIFNDLYKILDGYDLNKNDLVSIFNDFTNDYVESKNQDMWDDITEYREDFLNAFIEYIDIVLTYAGDEDGIDKEIVSQMESELQKIEKAVINNHRNAVKRTDISDFSDKEFQKILKYIATI